MTSVFPFVVDYDYTIMIMIFLNSIVNKWMIKKKVEVNICDTNVFVSDQHSVIQVY